MERWEYGDPFEVVARREAIAQRQERACGQCVHKVSVDWKGETYHGCEYKRRTYGVRCEFYREKKA
jgi:hypothetical protein